MATPTFGPVRCAASSFIAHILLTSEKSSDRLNNLIKGNTMVRIQKLRRPNKHSGNELLPGKTTKIRGMTITNTTSQVVYVDPFTRKPWKPKKKKKSKK